MDYKKRIQRTVAMIILMILMTSCCSVALSDTVHIVAPGDTLEEISVHYYGSELQMRLIMEANYLKEKGRLEAGKKLIIPRREWYSR